MLGKIGIEPSMDAEDKLVDDDDGLIWVQWQELPLLEKQGRMLDSKHNQGQTQGPQHHNQVYKRKMLILRRPRRRMLIVIN